MPGDFYDELAGQASAEPGSMGLSPNGRVHYLVANQDGSTGEIDEHTMLRQLAAVGYKPLSASADGMTISVAGPDGQPLEISTHDALQKMGWAVQASKPANPNYEHVNGNWRMLIESPALRDDDDAKKAVLTTKLTRSGLKEPKIMGSGSDWYAYDPDQAQWFALTNKPGMDMSDVGEGAAVAPRMLLSGLGGALGVGAGGGAGSIPGGMAGSALGGWAGDRISDAIAQVADTDYLAHANMGKHAVGMGEQLFTDALGGGFAGAVTKIPGLKNAVKEGVVGPLAQKLGAGIEGLGGSAAGLASAARKSPFIKEVGLMGGIPGVPGIPVVSELDALGWLGRLLRDMTTGTPKVMKWLGEKLSGMKPDPVKVALGEASASGTPFTAAGRKLEDLSARLTQGAGQPRPPTFSRQVANSITGAPDEETRAALTAADVLGNAGEAVGQKYGPGVGASRYREAYDTPGSGVRAAFDLDREFGRQYGFEAGMRGPELAAFMQNLERETAGDLQRSFAQRGAEELGARGRKIGETIGRGADKLAAGGEALRKTAIGATDAGLYGIEGLGRGMKATGKVLRSTGTIGGPLEVPMATNRATDEAYQRFKQKLLRGSLQASGRPRKMGPDQLVSK
jgi:hypothetical protein